MLERRQHKQCVWKSLCLLLLLPCVLVLPVVAQQEKGSNKHPFVTRTGQTPLMSNYLHSGTLSVDVLIAGKIHHGLYITTPTSGLANQMGLQKGSILLTIDDNPMSSALVADKLISQHQAGPLKFTCVMMQNGNPLIQSGELNYAPSKPALIAVQQLAPSQASSSIDELEKYGLTLINESRKQEGLSQLQQDSPLSRLARNYADYMLQHSDKYGAPLRRNPHIDLEGRIPIQRAISAGIIREVHENLGMETRGRLSDADLVLKQHKIMMSEPNGEHNHRSIILDRNAHAVGVGISRDKRYLYLVEEFGH